MKKIILKTYDRSEFDPRQWIDKWIHSKFKKIFFDGRSSREIEWHPELQPTPTIVVFEPTNKIDQ